jgi:lycopene beta-cyclase
VDVDVAIVGAGGAGLSLVLALDRRLAALPAAAPLRIALVDPVHRVANDRTWCFWHRGPAPVEDVVHRSWSQVVLVDRSGRERLLALDDLRYLMVRSADLYARADEAAARLEVARVGLAAESVTDGPDRATVRAGGDVLRARWVFDSRAAQPRLPGTVSLLQHFRGWTVRLDRPGFEPDRRAKTASVIGITPSSTASIVYPDPGQRPAR